MHHLILAVILILISLPIESKEKVLICEMNYGISGENDETDVEFKNLIQIDEAQTFYLDIENKWLYNSNINDFKNNESKDTEINTSINDSTIFTISKRVKENIVIAKHIIELNRYTGFVKHNFETNYEKIFRTGYCKISKNKLF